MTGLKRLEIHINVPPVAGDTSTGETTPDVLVLLGNLSGFSLNSPQAWQPQMAKLKAGGVYLDSQTQNGSAPQDFTYNDVTEKISLSLSMPTGIELLQQMTRLTRFIQKAQLFNTTYEQTNPVYFVYKDMSAEGEQYSVIYGADIELNKTSETTAEVTLTVTRQYYWTMFPPYFAPTAYDLYKQDKLVNVDNIISAPGIAPRYPLISATVQNKVEYDQTNAPYAPVTQNWIDVDGDDIEGDINALMYIKMTPTGAVPDNIFIAVSSKKPQDADGYTRDSSINFSTETGLGITNSASVTITQPTTTSALGLRADASVATYTRLQLVATNGSSGGEVKWQRDAQDIRGRYSVFVRGGTNAGASSVTGKLVVGQYLTEKSIGTFTFPNSQTGVTYVGEVDFPIATRSAPKLDQLGIPAVAQGADDLQFYLRDIINASGSTQTIYIIDIILLPVDEAAIFMRPDVAYIGYVDAYYDNTGYFKRTANALDMSYYYSNLSFNIGRGAGYVYGQSLTLRPKTDYRIFFLFHNGQATRSGTTQNTSLPSMTCDVDIDIVPRWIGIRDI